MGSESSERTRPSLIRRVRNPNDQNAWMEFWVQYRPLLERYVRHLRVKAHDVDDLVQEMYPKLRTRLPSFSYDPAKGRFRGWLRIVTDNTVRDFFRAHESERKKQGSYADYLMTLSDTPEQDAERERAWDKAVAALVMERIRQEFGRRQKTLECFEKSILQQRPAKDVASELGIANVNTVYVYASRVMARVKQLTQEYNGYDPEDQAQNP